MSCFFFFSFFRLVVVVVVGLLWCVYWNYIPFWWARCIDADALFLSFRLVGRYKSWPQTICHVSAIFAGAQVAASRRTLRKELHNNLSALWHDERKTRPLTTNFPIVARNTVSSRCFSNIINDRMWHNRPTIKTIANIQFSAFHSVGGQSQH